MAMLGTILMSIIGYGFSVMMMFGGVYAIFRTEDAQENDVTIGIFCLTLAFISAAITRAIV